MILLRLKLLLIFIIDIIINLFTAFFLPKDNIIYFKEIIISLMNSGLFYVILLLFSQILYFLKIKNEFNIIISLLLFLLIIFPHEKIFTKGNPIIFDAYIIPFSNIVLFIKYIFSICFIFFLYFIIKKRIPLIIAKLIKNEKDFKIIYKIISGAPFSGLLLYLNYHILNYLLSLLFQLHLIYKSNNYKN